MQQQSINNLYRERYGHEATEIVRLPGSGSSRRYTRLGPEPTVIACEGDDRKENEAFVYLCRTFRGLGLPVPELLAVADDFSGYLLEDIGDTSLFDILERTRQPDGSFPQETVGLLERTLELLAELQYRGGDVVDFSRCYPAEAMDRRMVDWDLNYFKYCFLKPAGVAFDEAALQDDFDRLATRLVGDNYNTFMYRDFQSRNVMIDAHGSPRFIDFQGGRRGPAEYDVASFLWQARAGFRPLLREHLIEVYLEAAQRFAPIDSREFRRRLADMVLFRTLQVLGAYGFRGLVEQKSHFIKSIPLALATAKQLVAEGSLDEYPALKRVLAEATELPGYEPWRKAEGLTVRVMSFSYHRGLPRDLSGNGGGFVFDCRAIHNPGRYDRYKPLTGRDAEVIEFLENDGEITAFLDHVYALVDQATERYLSRGFSDLMVAFGCTGGRHRSVYSAEHTARHLAEKFGVRVILEHREQDIIEILEP